MRRAFQRCIATVPQIRPSIIGDLPISAHRPIRFNSITRAAIASHTVATRDFHSTSLRKDAAESADGRDQAKEDSDAQVVSKFAELETRGLVHPTVVNTITRGMGLETMTEVQSATLHEALRGTDIIAQAKTGTGKTIAFLLPVLQNIIEKDPYLAKSSHGRRGPRTTADDIRALIISPTRELAEQIADEARKLVKSTGIIVQTAVGGTMKRQGMRDIQQQGCHILVGTPGRLKDILSDPYSRVEAPDLNALVFDEADRLLDQGFWPEIQGIMQLLPSPAQKPRQTLMFSATMSQDVITLARQTLKKGFKFVRTIRDDEAPTHARVPQNIVKLKGFENAAPALFELCQREIMQSENDPSKPPFKAMVYFNSAAEVSLYYSLFRALEDRSGRSPLLPAKTFLIHSRLSQMQRTRAAEDFKRCRSGIFLSSDVTARGMDFPGVTHVIQMGLATSREMYIHRIGRTARAGREGTGWLFVDEMEAREVRGKLGEMPLVPNDTLETARLDLTQAADISAEQGELLATYQKAIQQVPRGEKVKVFMSFFGTFAWHPRKQQLVDNMNRLATYGWGMEEPPMVSPSLLRRLPSFRNVTGLRLGHEPSDDDGSDMRRSSGRSPRDFGRRGGPAGGFGRVGPGFGRGVLPPGGSSGGSPGGFRSEGTGYGGSSRSSGNGYSGFSRSGRSDGPPRERRAQSYDY
ncbi:DEAD-domain-containing protein [Dissoconium aciculare CBS 342.82]|uniref:ATP-dependent RNA helicase n=1 Tax=Dissoconium aciculare CBS 342.82 TaxID=1314786 RepID=A0A6J3MAP5_9PEZI|nr:DEAD-domain-containing protein [Dissoconium aciculare CBS 342.82]KAF1825091.1 DEAD-domain-containing protein [Dissoconium aciculare CBS 342.82]